MKISTRIMAWLYILAQASIVIFAAIIIFLKRLGETASLTGLLHTGALEPWSEKIMMFRAMYVALAMVAVILFGIFPWVYLLKKRAWAWWVLVIETALGIIVGLPHQIISRLPIAGTIGTINVSSSQYIPALAIITLVLLLLDWPGSWKSKRTAKRKKKRTTHKRRARYSHRKSSRR